MKWSHAWLYALAVLVVSAGCVPQSDSGIADLAHESYRQRVAAEPGCERWGPYETPATYLFFPTPSPMPFPTPAGASVKPKEKDLPVFPGAELLDSFVPKELPDRLDDRDRTVQLYRTTAPIADVFIYFDRILIAGDWMRGSAVVGVAGVSCGWRLWADRDNPAGGKRYIQVTTQFVDREPRDLMTPPPGFQGKAVRFAEPEPGYTWFWVITPR
ncbi:MAG: hypothetical protein HY875_12650 [Chloroflexi bacterium]|nr:hypothetical protein [Chloroflexota bacterium]